MKFFSCLGILLIILSYADGQYRPVTVNTPKGSLLGREDYVNGKYIYSFRGIQYAEIPEGNKRFRPAGPFTSSWSSTKAVQEDGPPCPQPFVNTITNYREDCLHLTVWTPTLPSGRDELLAVIFVIHGDLHTQDNIQLYPEDLVSYQNVVVVKVSYRLNVFGFLSLENPVMPGNLGLLDQYYALYWVYLYIQYLGGDPNQITVLGTGSGASDALYHALSPISTPYIKRVISVSGSPLSPWGTSVKPQDNALRFIQLLDCVRESTNEVLDCLQQVSTKDIIMALESHLSRGNVSQLFGPVDDTFLNPKDQYLGANFSTLVQRFAYSNQLPIMFGENIQDGESVIQYLSYFLDSARAQDISYRIENTFIPAALHNNFNLVNNRMIHEMLMQQYFPEADNQYQISQEKEKLLERLEQFFTDYAFVSPIKATLNQLSDARFEVFHFVNDYKFSTFRTADLKSFYSLLFGNSQYTRLNGGRQMTRDEERESLRVQDWIIQFVKFGKPSTSTQWNRILNDSSENIALTSNKE